MERLRESISRSLGDWSRLVMTNWRDESGAAERCAASNIALKSERPLRPNATATLKVNS